MATVAFQPEHHRAVRKALDFTRAVLIANADTFLGAGCTDSTLTVDMLAELEERMRCELATEAEQRIVDRILAYGQNASTNVVAIGGKEPW